MTQPSADTPQRQTVPAPALAPILSRRARLLQGGLFCLALLALFVFAVSVPFLFESSSLYYKMGIFKTLLRGGKVVGITTAMLAFFQVALISRMRLPDRIFGLNRLYALHQANGLLIALLVLTHGFVMFAAEKFVFFPLEKRYWPEFLGMGLAIFILCLTAGAVFRRTFGLPYQLWARLHGVLGFVALTLITTHALAVSESFLAGPPRVLMLSLLAGSSLLLARRLLRRFFPGGRRLAITAVREVARDTCSVTAAVPPGAPLPYLPGQFAFITASGAATRLEEHPFTIASTPTRPETLEFIIRACGDWTRTVGRLKAGDTLAVDGPYGRFSHLLLPEGEPLILIAGGIGITPMLSMLRFMADTGDGRPVLLVWSCRGPEDVPLSDEFESLRKNLAGLRIERVFTRKAPEGGQAGRLNEERLAGHLAGFPRPASVFLCGPPSMMEAVARALRSLGFSSAAIYREDFRF